MPSTPEIISLLSSFTTCELSDALIKLGLPHGGHIPDIHMVSPSPPSETRICGPAYTVQMVPVSSESPTLSAHFVDTAPVGSIIVIDAPARSVRFPSSVLLPFTFTSFVNDPEARNAVWGGLMTAGAQARSAIGVIIGGRCRDLVEHRRAQFPVFARGHSTLGQSTFTRPSAINVPLIMSPMNDLDGFPAVKVEPGDWMIADEDGVVCIPRELAWKTIELASKGKEVDSKCMEDINAGMGVQASFKRHRGK